MKLYISYCICISLSLVIFTGAVGAHPHKNGDLNHGPSLENYQTDFNFTIERSPKRGLDTEIIFANKNQSKNNKRGRSIATIKLDLSKNKKNHKGQKIEQKKEQKTK